MASVALLHVAFIIFEVHIVHGRNLGTISSGNLLSDGIHATGNQPSVLDSFHPSPSSPSCKHMYGFFPCAENIGGYMFQMVVYQYLLVIGGKLVTTGSKTLFNIIGTGVFGASVFRVLMVCPKIVMVIVSGVLKSKVGAQDKVSFGVGVYAGSTVLNLTLLWGMCMILGTGDLSTESAPDLTKSSTSKSLLGQEKLSYLKGRGVKVDEKTCYTAGIMLLSLIPYVIIQLASVVRTSFLTRMVILTALIISTTLLISYFLYQIFHPWIQERSLEYSKYENLLAGFLHHVQRHAKEKLVDENGKPNVPVIKRLFHHTDKDADKCLTLLELENLILEMQSGKLAVDKDYAVSEILKVFDLNSDGRIEEHEFLEGCTKWINEAQKLAANGDSTSRKLLRDVIQPSGVKRRAQTEVEHLMARILKHVQSQSLAADLLMDDGKPNVEHIKDLFKKFDTDQSSLLSRSELEQLIRTIEFGEMQLDYEEMGKKLIKDFDMDGDNSVDEQEFIHGVTKWVDKAIHSTNCKDTKKAIDEFDKIVWKEVDNLVYEVKQDISINSKILTWDFQKSIFLVMLGIVILTFLSGPLINSIQQLSDAIGVPSFFISFVIVPVAMNARSAILAVFPASQKSSRTSSLTFSEIYGGVAMNNIMGLSTLLSIVYIKDLTWDYSAEVLTILVVCAMMGILAFSCTTYPLWAWFISFSLYPFSLVLYYVLQYLLGWD